MMFCFYDALWRDHWLITCLHCSLFNRRTTVLSSWALIELWHVNLIIRREVCSKQKQHEWVKSNYAIKFSCDEENIKKRIFFDCLCRLLSSFDAWESRDEKSTKTCNNTLSSSPQIHFDCCETPNIISFRANISIYKSSLCVFVCCFFFICWFYFASPELEEKFSSIKWNS